ncbi:glyoxalase [Glycocaulis profundi]|nr:glyoxalase [Glycocaulis profundi]
MSQPPRIYPTFRFRDPDRMIGWLKAAFGFEEHAVHRDEAGGVVHAELALGPSMIMCGADRRDAYGALVGEAGPASGGRSLYLAVDDADAAYEQAKAAGAVIEEELTDRDYGSREFICRDPEGNIWCLGTYRPG